jgi:trans-aconitate 2-methyltransferase
VDRDDFVTQYKARLAAAYPPRADGRTLFAFQRLFVVAVRA